MNKTVKEVLTSTGQGGKNYEYQQSQNTESGGVGSVDNRKQKLINSFEEYINSLASTYKPSGSSGDPGKGTPGDQRTGGQQPYQGTPSTGLDAGGTQGGEAFELTVPAQRESYLQDRAREQARASESATEAPSSIPTDMVISNKHMSDSSKAPLQDTQEFTPSYGTHGRSKSSSMEVIAVPAGESGRPKTTAASPVTFGEPLDAYWASFGTAVERAQERAKIAIKQTSETKRLELIIGSDDRVLVTNNEAYPWHCICSLLITAKNGGVYLGTGWLVSPRLLLTAGHCVYMHNEGGWASQIEVIPGRNGASRPFGSVITRDLRSVRGWTRDRDRDYDYGAILLPEERRLGEELGWFGFAARTDDHFSGITLNLSGYPGDGGKAGSERQQGTQWFNSREVKDANEKQITYEIDTWGGQSGSPVWEMTSDGSRYGLAIHTWGTTVSNGATRITREVFDNIINWTSQVP